MLHRLPVEVLELIVPYLDAQDIDNLFSIDYFKEKLGESVLLLQVQDDKSGDSNEDSNEDFEESTTGKKNVRLSDVFPNLTKRCTLEEFNNRSFNLESFVCLIILTEDLGSEAQIQDLNICKKYCVPNIDYCKIRRDTFSFLNRENASKDTVCYLDALSFDLRATLDYLHLPMVQFPKLLEIELRKVTFNPSNIDLPLLTELILVNCESSSVSSRWKLPNLEKLRVKGKFKTINASIDYGNTTMEQIQLTDLTDMCEWSGIPIIH